MVYLASPAGGHKSKPRHLQHFRAYADHAISLYSLYSTTTRREIWGPDPLRSFCHQLESLIAVDKLRGVELDKVADAVRRLIVQLNACAVTDSAGAHPLSLRYEAGRTVSATYLLRKPAAAGIAFVSLENPHFVKSADGNTARYLSRQFDYAWQRAPSLSTSKPTQAAYFASLETSTERRLARLLALGR